MKIEPTSGRMTAHERSTRKRDLDGVARRQVRWSETRDWLRRQLRSAERDERRRAREQDYGGAQYAKGLAAAYAFALLHVERVGP